MCEQEVATRQFRHRVNISFTSKGLPAYDATVEGTGYSREEIIAEIKATMDLAKALYPLEVTT